MHMLQNLVPGKSTLAMWPLHVIWYPLDLSKAYWDPMFNNIPCSHLGLPPITAAWAFVDQVLV